MGVNVEISYESLNKQLEELCGDKVEVVKREDSDIIILADGMGSGVKANILATLTSKILGTMLQEGASIDACVETIAKTLPVCKVRQVAYSTFSILQIFHDGQAYLAEFDNPGCICIREHQLYQIPFVKREVQGKKIRESHFHVQINDYYVLMSDGVIHAGVGKVLNFGWSWENVAGYAVEAVRTNFTARRLSNTLVRACNELYMQRPGDDTTIATARVITRRIVHLMTGPPVRPEEDQKMVCDFMKEGAIKIVCGGTTAQILSRQLGKKMKTTLDYVDPKIPPIAYIDGIDLVTEGVLTLSTTLKLLQQYERDEVDADYFQRLDEKNGASLVAKKLIEDCTDLHLFVGRAINVAHQNPDLPFDLSIRMNLVKQMEEVARNMGKEVVVTYY